MILKLTLWFCLLVGAFASRKIPKDFLLGAATSAFQVEGGWNEDGKGESMWDVNLHNTGGENADVACDSYHKWEEDIANAKALGLDSYRLSISWPRILSNGTLNTINQKGIDYYLNLIKGLKEAGIEPMVTLYHWDMPQHINELGGFLNPQFVDYFEDYARLVYKSYAPYVKYWFTFNEPSLACSFGYGSSGMAPGLDLKGDGVYQCSYVLLKAHARAYRIYDEEFKPQYKGQVGIVFNSNWFEAGTNKTEDIEAQERGLQFYLGWFANPIFLGNWPQVMIDRIANRSALEGLARSRLPGFTQEEIDYINGTHDFFALNTYGVSTVYNAEYPISSPDYNFDSGIVWGFQNTDPEGFRELINYIDDRYKPKGIVITENGLRTGDNLDDSDRISYITSSLHDILEAVQDDHINVFGYTVWSLMDNFEWGSYDPKYGLIRVDFESSNRTRTWKKSAYWYQNVIATRILEDD